VHSYNAFANARALLAVIRARIPHYLTYEHGTVWKVSFPMTWFERWAHRRAQLVIANSQASARLLHIRYGVPVDKIRVVYNAIATMPQVDVQLVRAQLGVGPDTLVVGSVGRLDTPKDYATLIDAAARIVRARSDVLFVIVGGGAHEDELRARVTELDIQRHFIITGWREDARRLLQAFDLFVSTSIRESFGNVLIEAALSEKAVIAPRIDGVPEAVIDAHTGVLLSPTEPVRQYFSPRAAPQPRRVLIDGYLSPPRALDPELLADKIIELLDNPELRLQYGQQAKVRAERLFSIDRYRNELEKIYCELAN
jgi:glycosyltransferase involved in cell wall biosynthesis